MKVRTIAVLALLAIAGLAQAQDKKPNIVVFWGDDIGQSNVSAYSHGLMGYKTPNIDRVAREGMMFTDYVGMFLESFKEFPQRQKAASFNLDEVMEQMKKPGGG